MGIFKHFLKTIIGRSSQLTNEPIAHLPLATKLTTEDTEFVFGGIQSLDGDTDYQTDDEGAEEAEKRINTHFIEYAEAKQAAASSMFKHAPLDLISQRIRLLRMKPCPKSVGFIECELEDFCLQDCPAYTALSYTWGSPTQQLPILLDGKQFLVRKNLWDFLYTTARVLGNYEIGNQKYLVSWIWIDALCIDQGNELERNHQVGIMAPIFQAARAVLVWLGEPSPESEVAIEFILSDNKPKTVSQYFPPHFFETLRDGDRHKRGAKLKRLLDGSDHKEGLLEAVFRVLADFFARTYWSRLWILQEVMLAKKLEVMCGYNRVKWESLSTTMRWVDDLVAAGSVSEIRGAFTDQADDVADLRLRTLNYPDAKHIIPPNVRAILRRAELASRQSTNSWAPLSSGDFADSKCENILDRIYGLLGLLPKDANIAVDYSKSAEELMIHVLYKFHLWETRPFWKHNWPQEGIHLNVRRALQLFEVDEAAVEHFAWSLCKQHPPIDNDEDAMELWKRVQGARHTRSPSRLKETRSFEVRKRRSILSMKDQLDGLT